MGMENEASWCAMEAADESKEGGTEVMPTATPDSPETGGVDALRTGKGKPSRSAHIVARKATAKASAGRSAPIRKEPGSGNCSGHIDKGNGQESHYAEGFGKAGKGSAFVTKHEANSMKQTTPRSDQVWYVNSGASNHMTSHME